ncbi:hypothetical protein AVEN_51477-1 [Araneus ventricosus]|uniref:Uncharacterized protein n=1 Tax=Araneus ventricosus TaxID=182803 RepID=A0A4Y2V3R4_ARAVE|nr:hypothetical protein AVEN_51477-1 [Araneus ventricosus]
MSLHDKLVANLPQVRFMVTSKLSLTCCTLAASLHSCHDKFVVNLHSCHDKFVASLLQTKIAIWVMDRLHDGSPADGSKSSLVFTSASPDSAGEALLKHSMKNYSQA